MGPLGLAKGSLYGLTFELPGEIPLLSPSAVSQAWLRSISAEPQGYSKPQSRSCSLQWLVPDSPCWLWHKGLEGKGAEMVLMPGREVCRALIRINICPTTNLQPCFVPRGSCSGPAPQLCPTMVPSPWFPSNPSTTAQPKGAGAAQAACGGHELPMPPFAHGELKIKFCQVLNPR